MNIARLLLNINCFAFENKYYQQIRGVATGSPITMTVSNIYMFECKQPLKKYQTSHGELYSRYASDQTTSLADA